MNSDQAAATAAVLPKLKRTTLEDECTHILSEHLNDRAPLGEEMYRPAARRMVEVISAAERDRIKEGLLETMRERNESYGTANSDRWLLVALNRICPEE